MNSMIDIQDTKPVTLLLVEDDDGDAKAVRRALRRARVANPVRRTVDGIDALDFLRSPEANLDENRYILLVDINMPRMNGHELIAEIRRDPALRRLVIFVLTTSRDPVDVMTAYDNFIAGYVVKDSAGTDFLELTRLLEAFWCLVEFP